MRFDKERLNELISLPDDKLWREVLRIAEGFGYRLREDPPPHEELERVRRAVREEKINPMEAMRLVNRYKKRGEK